MSPPLLPSTCSPCESSSLTSCFPQTSACRNAHADMPFPPPCAPPHPGGCQDSRDGLGGGRGKRRRTSNRGRHTKDEKSVTIPQVRYAKTFEDKGALGKGSFGSVYKAKAMDNGYCKHLGSCPVVA